MLRLQSYNYNVIYKPGKVNIADPLSRLCEYLKSPFKGGDEHIHQIAEQARPHMIPMMTIIDASGSDKEINDVKNGVYDKEWHESVKGYKIFENEFCFYGNILLRGTRIVLRCVMKGRLRSKVWWPRIDKDAENIYIYYSSLD